MMGIDMKSNKEQERKTIIPKNTNRSISHVTSEVPASSIASHLISVPSPDKVRTYMISAEVFRCRYITIPNA